MDIRVIEREEIKVVGIAWNGLYSQVKQIPQLFTCLENRIDEVLYQKNDHLFIAPFHCRETELTYYVTVPVEEISLVPEGMVGFTIPEKHYIFCTHYGTASEIAHTYQRIKGWMEDYGYEQDHQALCLEVYNASIKENQNLQEKIHFEIYVPVKTYAKLR